MHVKYQVIQTKGIKMRPTNILSPSDVCASLSSPWVPFLPEGLVLGLVMKSCMRNFLDMDFLKNDICLM